MSFYKGMISRVLLILLAASLILSARVRAGEITTEMTINAVSNVEDLEILKKWYTYGAQQLGEFLQQGRLVMIPSGSLVDFSRNAGYWTVSVQGEGTYFTLQDYVTAATWRQLIAAPTH
jgi:hypothetical protein